MRICFYSSFLNLKVTCKQYLDLFFISSNLLITLKNNQKDSLFFCKSHNPNNSMFKTKTHNAYIIMINKESCTKKKSHKDSIENHHDSRRLHDLSINFINPLKIKGICATLLSLHI